MQWQSNTLKTLEITGKRLKGSYNVDQLGNPHVRDMSTIIPRRLFYMPVGEGRLEMNPTRFS